MDFTINCFCGCPGTAPAGGQGLMVVTGATYAAWQAVVANFTGITCPTCGCTQRLADGGLNSIISTDTAEPRIDSLTVVTGPAAGGTAVTINGHRLNTAGLVVKFGGVTAANLRAQTNGSCTVDTPAHAAGAVNVTVQNTNGQRALGGSLTSGFTYT
jgi:hypothetical protein